MGIEEAAPAIAAAMLEMVRQHKTAPEPLRRYYYVSLKWMARHLESFVEPRVSVAAQAKAVELGIGDLHSFRWLDQPGKMKDPGRVNFHWEHATQTSDVVKAILQLPEPSADAIAPILATMTIVWITKDENRALPNGPRPNGWELVYREARIQVLPRP